jgi:hypothetical protein
MAANQFLSRAEKATRSSKRVALRDSVDYVELVRDLAAMANSGGGVIVLDGVAGVDEELLHEQLSRYAEPEFEGFEVEPLRRDGRPSTAVVVEGVRNAPLVFTAGGPDRRRSRCVRAGRAVLPARREERGGDGRGCARLHPPAARRNAGRSGSRTSAR